MVTPATVTGTVPSPEIATTAVPVETPLVITGIPTIPISTEIPVTPIPDKTTVPLTPTPTPQLGQRTTEGELVYLRQRLAEVEAERRAQTTEAALVQEARAVQQEAQARGLSEEDALWVAKNHYTVAKRVGEEQQRLRDQQQYLRDQQAAAVHIAREYGVDPNVLMTGASSQEMQAIAQREKRYLAQEARLKALEQAQVPAQKLDNSNGSRAGNVVASADNIDKLWMEWEIEESRNPTGRANPYDAQYRHILGR